MFIQFCLSGLFIIVVNGYCYCNDFGSQEGCQSPCIWNSDSDECQDISDCSKIKNQIQCTYPKCFWNTTNENNSCATFKDRNCPSISSYVTANTSNGMNNAGDNCLLYGCGTDGTNCIVNMSDCRTISCPIICNQSIQPSLTSPFGLNQCVWSLSVPNGPGCMIKSSCEGIIDEGNCGYENDCSWENSNQLQFTGNNSKQCITRACLNQTDQPTCENLNQCHWNSTCLPYNCSIYLDDTSCINNNNYNYYCAWSKKSNGQMFCKDCQTTNSKINKIYFIVWVLTIMITL